MIIDIDFSQSQVVPIDEGVYVVKVSSIEQKTSRAGSPYLNVEFTIVDGKFKNRHVYTMFSLKENAVWKLANFLAVVGVKIEDKIKLDTDLLIGRKLKVTVRKRSYQKSDGSEGVTTDVVSFMPYVEEDIIPKETIKEEKVEKSESIDIGDLY